MSDKSQGLCGSFGIGGNCDFRIWQARIVSCKRRDTMTWFRKKWKEDRLNSPVAIEMIIVFFYNVFDRLELRF
jgi:hypothetical protein